MSDRRKSSAILLARIARTKMPQRRRLSQTREIIAQARRLAERILAKTLSDREEKRAVRGLVLDGLRAIREAIGRGWREASVTVGDDSSCRSEAESAARILRRCGFNAFADGYADEIGQGWVEEIVIRCGRGPDYYR